MTHRERDHAKYDRRRALAYVSLPGFNRTGRARWNLEAPLSHRGFYISVGYTDKPYGRSTHTSAYLSHIVSGVLLVWKNGSVVEQQVIWRCGARAWKFRLLDEPTSTICPACKIERVPRENPRS